MPEVLKIGQETDVIFKSLDNAIEKKKRSGS